MTIKSNDKSSTVLGVFTTPFSRVLAGHSDHIDSLKEFVLSRESEEYANKNSPQKFHKALFESSFDFFSWQDQPVQILKACLHRHLISYLQSINHFELETLQRLNFHTESWFHITYKGGYFQPHTHPLASVSMVYCVDPGDTEISNPHESGQILFSDPRANASMYLDPANRNMKREYSYNGLRFRLRPDELCVFPSYLQHSVEPYVGEKPRITIAANFSFQLM